MLLSARLGVALWPEGKLVALNHSFFDLSRCKSMPILERNGDWIAFASDSPDLSCCITAPTACAHAHRLRCATLAYKSLGKGGCRLVLGDHKGPHHTTGAAIAGHCKGEGLLHEP